MKHFKVLATVIICLLCITSTGCGQSGPLYLPGQKPPVYVPPEPLPEPEDEPEYIPEPEA